MLMKKLLLTLVTLCVAVSSWGYAVNELIKAYDPKTGTYDESIIYAILDANNLTCFVYSCTSNGDENGYLKIPATVYTDQKQTVKVVASSANWGSPLRNKTTGVYKGNIKTLEFSEGLTHFYPHSIWDIKAETIILPSTVNNIGAEHFGKQENLRKIVVSENNPLFIVKKSEENSDCLVNRETGDLIWPLAKDENGHNLTSLTIPEGVTSLSKNVDRRFFQENANQGITTITLPSTLEYIRKNLEYARHALTKCTGLTTINVAPGNPDFCSYDGILYKKPYAIVDGVEQEWGETIFIVPEAKFSGDSNVELPEGVKIIDDIAFNNTKMKSILISDDVTTIGRSAFNNVAYLRKITIPAATTSIGEGFVGGCQSLNEIIVMDGNPNYSSYLGSMYTADHKTLIAYPTARLCDKNEVTGEIIPYKLHEDTETIGANAFNKTRAEAVDLCSAPNLKYLKNGCFGGAIYLKSLKIPKSVQLIEQNALNSMKVIESLEFENNDDPTSTLEIEPYSMASADGKVKEIVFPKQLVKFSLPSLEGATKISFAEGSRLTTIDTFTTHAKNIEEIDMTNCTQLTTLVQGFVQECPNLKVVKLPASLETVRTNAFFNTPALETLEFAEGSQLKNIGSNTFQNCGVRTLTLPDHVETVGREAFAYCENLTEISIPETAYKIDPQAFKYCNNLVKFTVNKDNNWYASTDGMLASKDKKKLVIFPPAKSSEAGTMISPSFEEIGEYACYACTNLKGIVFPKYLKKIGNYAFEFCDNLNSITFLGELPPANVDADVATDNAKTDDNLKDHRFGNASESPREFLKNHVTINLRKNGHEEDYQATGCYWNDAKEYTYSFSAANGKNGGGAVNKFDYLATSATSVAVLGSSSTNHTAVVPEKVLHEGKEYTVAIVGDYAFDHLSEEVKEIVFLGPIELIGTNAFNNGHLGGVYNPEPKSYIEQIIFANTESVGKCELSTQRFELGTEFGTDEYPEFTADQKIYVAKSKLSEYKENMPKFKNQIDYKIPGITIGSKYGTFSREFDVDLADTDGENWDAEKNRPKVAAFTGYVKTVTEDDMTYVVMRSINCNTESKESTGAGDGTYIPANTGVLLRAYDGSTPEKFYYRIGEQKSSYTAPAENVMMTVTENGTTINPTDGDYTNYIISGGRYYSLTSSVAIPVHKSYLHIPNVSNSKRLTLVFNDEGDLTTGIKNVTTDANDDIIYNLQGQRIYGSAKGMVIKNGKKIFVK